MHLRVRLVICVFWVLGVGGHSYSSEVKFLKVPDALSNLKSATFVFKSCTNCNLSCKLDDIAPSDCESREVSFKYLQDGNHTFEVCTNGSQGVGCARYHWTIDTIPPTAFLTASTSFTAALNVSVNISFSEPCIGQGGFGCSTIDSCNLLVYGGGQVIPSSLNILLPNLKYSLLVALPSSAVQYGRVIIVMDKNFCTDNAGNKFTRTENSSLYVHFDRRTVFVNLRPHLPEMLLQLNNETRTVQATSDYNKLKVFLYFSEPVLNSSTEILNSLNTSQGLLVPTSDRTLGKHRYGFLVTNISSFAILTINLDSSSIISKQGTPVSPVVPATFLYDSQRPAVRLSTTANMRTRDCCIPISVKFMKPVFGFNSSGISILGGHLQSFRELSRSVYTVEIHADGDIVSVYVPENVTSDVAGNKNLASNILQVDYYAVPSISLVVSTFTTTSFLVTSVVAGLLTASTSSLQSTGAFSRPSFSLTSHPARNLFRIACHIQVFALSRWLAVTLPVEYYEFARSLQWSIPYFSLPWEKGYTHAVMAGSSMPGYLLSYMSKVHDLQTFPSVRPELDNLSMNAVVHGTPLSSTEYKWFFEGTNMEPEAEYIKDPQDSSGWRDFKRSMFWLAVTGGGLVLLHVSILLIMKCRKKISEKRRDYGALKFPRFEIFLIFLALPCICKPSATLLRGGKTSGIIVGILILGVASFLLLALFMFISIGIAFGKLLQYKEIHQEDENIYWYQDIVRMTLGPGKRGQWTWNNRPNSDYLIMLGPLFEDLSGPPKYMLTQIAGGTPRKCSDTIITTDDETEDAEAPFIQKLLGIVRIYYTFLELVKRVSLGIVAGAYLKMDSSKTPILTVLCITSFQLFFLILKKPFIKKKVQLVEIITVSCEVGIFATCFVLLEKEFSRKDETKLGIFMLILFLLGYLAQLINEWYALYRQTKRLDPADDSFISGLELALIGFLLLFIPQKLIKNLENRFPVNQLKDGATADMGSSVERYRSSGSRSSSGTTDRPWLRHLRDMAKGSFNKEGSGNLNDPSTSRAGWSGFWGSKRSGSSSLNSSSDSKSKPSKLYKDMEAIFASK